MKRSTTAFVISGVLVVLAPGCSHKSGSDPSITTDIQARLYNDAVTKPASVSVAVYDGIVTLTGDVGSSDIALEATKIASGTPGVQSVNDQLKVNGTAVAQLPNAGTPVSTSEGQASYPSLSSSPAPPGSAPPAAPLAAAPPPPAEPATVTVPAGERVTVRMIDSINSATNTSGQVFRGSLYGPITVNGRVVVPAGEPVSVLLTDARDAGRIKGRSELEVRFSRLEYHGHSYAVDSSIYDEEGKARGKQTAVKTGVGAAAGAIIGAIAGGGRGAAIGSAAGGGAGFGSDLFTHGQQVKIPSESILTFRLETPLTVQRP